MAPAQADAYLEPLTNILSAPGSAGLGVVTHFFLHDNWGGVKLLNGDAQRFELFIELPGRQRQAGVTQAQLPGPDD
jgi:outer membrane protein